MCIIVDKLFTTATNLHVLVFVWPYSAAGTPGLRVVFLAQGFSDFAYCCCKLNCACVLGLWHDGDDGRLISDLERLR